MKKYTWCSDALVEALNGLGFVHFVVKEPMSNFIEGNAFFYDEDRLIYGYVGFITEDHLKEAEGNREYIINKAEEYIK